MTLNGGTQKATRIQRRLVDATDGNEMRLSDVTTIKTHYPEADFWLVRRGSLKTCGQPTLFANYAITRNFIWNLDTA